MNYSKRHIALLVTLAASIPAVVLFDAQISHGQTPAAGKSSTQTESRVKPTSIVRERRAGVGTSDHSAAASFAEAATRNAFLRTELYWIFGGKQQRGWNLYLPLIQRLLNTNQQTGANGFALALARWQEKSGLQPSGVLDEESWYAMVSAWQGARLKIRDYPAADQLITAPSSDFYDPSRPDELRQVEREAYAAYKRMISAAAADPSVGLARGVDAQLAPTELYFKIISPFRTREYQEKLRRESPHAGRAGLAINSPHFTGRALDIYVGGDPVDTRDSNRALQVQTRAYQWLVRNAERFGFRPYYYEPWHWEYVR